MTVGGTLMSSLARCAWNEQAKLNSTQPVDENFLLYHTIVEQMWGWHCTIFESMRLSKQLALPLPSCDQGGCSCVEFAAVALELLI